MICKIYYTDPRNGSSAWRMGEVKKSELFGKMHAFVQIFHTGIEDPSMQKPRECSVIPKSDIHYIEIYRKGHQFRLDANDLGLTRALWSRSKT